MAKANKRVKKTNNTKDAKKKKASALAIQPFAPPKDDGLGLEHVTVTRFVNEAIEAMGHYSQYKGAELKAVASGQAIADADPDRARRLIRAAVAQLRHLDREDQRIRKRIKSEAQLYRTTSNSWWEKMCSQRKQTEGLVSALLRRALPFEKSGLLDLLEWCMAAGRLSSYGMPFGYLTRALERYCKDHPIEPDLADAMRRFSVCLRDGYGKDVKRLGTQVEQLLAQAGAGDAPEPEVAVRPVERRPATRTPAGDPGVMKTLKAHLGLAAAEPGETVTREAVGRDEFQLRSDSPLKKEHAFVTEMLDQLPGNAEFDQPMFKKTAAGKELLALPAKTRGRVLLAAAERAADSLLNPESENWQARYHATSLYASMLEHPFSLDRNGTFDLLLMLAARPHLFSTTVRPAYDKLIDDVEAFASQAPLSDGERYVLSQLRAALIGGPPLGATDPRTARLSKLIGDGFVFFLVPSEVWSERVNADLSDVPPAARKHWTALLKYLITATPARPSEKWLATAGKIVQDIGATEVRKALLRWFPLVSAGRTFHRNPMWYGDTRTAGDVIHEENANVLRGMLWIAPTLGPSDHLARAVCAVAVSAYKKIPGVGPRAVKVGNAAVYALSEMASEAAVGQLAMLKVRVKFGTAQKEIEKAFNVAAEALGLPRDQIEEMGVPSYGLEDVGLRREAFGEEYRAELRVDGRDVTIAWSRADGKPQKSVPAKVKSDFKEEWKDLQAAAKDIAMMLPAQAERIDSMFLLQKRWPVSTWRERYLDHPLVGTIGRRLIWSFGHEGRERTGIWWDGRIVGADDQPLDLPADGAEVSLWHPIGRPTDEVLAWRNWLERHEVRQPFKQAHREIYLLTDAERRTATYSNRFAAHIIRQHQFNALCAARGWKNRLRLMVDDTYPPATKELPPFGLRAEFWIEGIGDDYGTDTTESGAYLRLATDQVRFYRIGAATSHAHAGGGGYTSQAAGPGADNVNEPLPLDQVPPLVLSEIMRDVDLFVGVASVGNDPNWQDGGPQGRYREYWHHYSFGELSATAQTRRDVLQRLVPRLKIKDRCSLTDKFLVVRGNLRTYKIHLGSGNILMEPNDQYLCIVPSQSKRDAGAGDVFLPFEGDTVLSIILSKAFLLAEDTKITDPTITRQIKMN